VVAAVFCAGLQLGRIGTGGRLGDAERLQPELPGGDAGKVFLLLRLTAMTQQRTHDVHLSMAGAGVASGSVDFLQRRRGSAQRQSEPAELFRDQRR
jgi:hypothetical protein